MISKSLRPTGLLLCETESLGERKVQTVSFIHLISSFYYLFIYLYLLLAVWGLHCCARAFSSCGEQGLLFIAVGGLLVTVTSLVAEHGL